MKRAIASEIFLISNNMYLKINLKKYIKMAAVFENFNDFSALLTRICVSSEVSL